MASDMSTPSGPAAERPRRLETASHISQIIASIAVVISVVYVAMQLTQSTAQLRRAENNATVMQFQAIRLSIVENRAVAELVFAGLYGAQPLDPPDALRLEAFLSEFTWSTFHIWDRAQAGLLDREEFTRGGAPTLARMLCTRNGNAWWLQNKAQFVAGFGQEVDAAIAKMPPAACGAAPQ